MPDAHTACSVARPDDSDDESTSAWRAWWSTSTEVGEEASSSPRERTAFAGLREGSGGEGELVEEEEVRSM